MNTVADVWDTEPYGYGDDKDLETAKYWYDKAIENNQSYEEKKCTLEALIGRK